MCYTLYPSHGDSNYFLGLCRFFFLAKLYYAYAIFAGYLLQFYVPMDFLETPLYSRLRLHTLEYKYPRQRHRIFPFFQILFRVVVVIITGMYDIVHACMYVCIYICWKATDMYEEC